MTAIEHRNGEEVHNRQVRAQESKEYEQRANAYRGLARGRYGNRKWATQIAGLNSPNGNATQHAQHLAH